MNKRELIKQTAIAFDYIQKLYLEVSYLIKEIEGMLSEEDEHFLIGRGGGYAITARSSNGLEANNVHLWPLRTFSVFFVPEEFTKAKSGVTITRFVKDLKTIFIKFYLDGDEINEPFILIGTMFDVESKIEKYSKFENLISHIEYNHNKIFTDDSVEYEDGYFKFRGNFFKVNLFDISSSEQIKQLVIDRVLEMFRTV